MNCKLHTTTITDVLFFFENVLCDAVAYYADVSRHWESSLKTVSWIKPVQSNLYKPVKIWSLHVHFEKIYTSFNLHDWDLFLSKFVMVPLA